MGPRQPGSRGRSTGTKVVALDPPRGLQEVDVCVEDRIFSLRIISYQNGCFVSVSEGDARIGSLIVSLYNGSTPVTTQVIPAKYESLFMRLVSEKLAVRTNGVAIVSVSIRQDITAAISKEIMHEIDRLSLG